MTRLRWPGSNTTAGKLPASAGGPLGRCTVYRRITAGLCGFRGAHGHADVGRLGGLTAFWPMPLGIGFQHRKCFSPAHKLGVLAAPEALAAGQQPDGL